MFNSTIEDLVAGRWINAETGQRVATGIRAITIEDSMEGGEAELVARLEPGRRLAVISDRNTFDALGRRVEQALAKSARIDSVVLDTPHADIETVHSLMEITDSAEALIAVGSGTINDLCKYASFLDDRRYVVFPTAASMNGYTTSTASITLDGLKSSLPARPPVGVFVDLQVLAAAPSRLSASGFSDSICRSTAQTDWLLSHRLRDSFYHSGPFLMQADDEGPLLEQAAGLRTGDLESFRRLCRVLILCGLGTCLTGTSHHGSMSEHLISHYIDIAAGSRHPDSLHGEQVGVAALSMNRLQHRIIDSDNPPVLKATLIDEAGMRRRLGRGVTESCLTEFKPKVLNDAGAAELNTRLAERWQELRRELQSVMLSEEQMEQAMSAAGAHQTANSLGLSADFYREAVIHAREIRNRFSILDIAGDAGLLEDFAGGEG